MGESKWAPCPWSDPLKIIIIIIISCRCQQLTDIMICLPYWRNWMGLFTVFFKYLHLSALPFPFNWIGDFFKYCLIDHAQLENSSRMLIRNELVNYQQCSLISTVDRSFWRQPFNLMNCTFVSVCLVSSETVIKSTENAIFPEKCT